MKLLGDRKLVSWGSTSVFPGRQGQCVTGQAGRASHSPAFLGICPERPHVQGKRLGIKFIPCPAQTSTGADNQNGGGLAMNTHEPPDLSGKQFGTSHILRKTQCFLLDTLGRATCPRLLPSTDSMLACHTWTSIWGIFVLSSARGIDIGHGTLNISKRTT